MVIRSAVLHRAPRFNETMEKRLLDYDEIMRCCSAITWQYDYGSLSELSKLSGTEQYLLRQKIIGCMVSLWSIMNELSPSELEANANKAIHDNKEDA
jgi:hypothetical protein